MVHMRPLYPGHLSICLFHASLQVSRDVSSVGIGSRRFGSAVLVSNWGQQMSDGQWRREGSSHCVGGKSGVSNKPGPLSQQDPDFSVSSKHGGSRANAIYRCTTSCLRREGSLVAAAFVNEAGTSSNLGDQLFAEKRPALIPS